MTRTTLGCFPGAAVLEFASAQLDKTEGAAPEAATKPIVLRNSLLVGLSIFSLLTY
jgi:hypothetical protein